MPKRVVFDTNVVISGLLWRGKPFQCLLLARSGLVQAVYCPQMQAELSTKLRIKFGFSEERVRSVVRELHSYAEQVQIPDSLRAVLADPDDDKFIECALVGRANWVVSGDRHLLSLQRYRNIAIVNATEFVERLVSGSES